MSIQFNTEQRRHCRLIESRPATVHFYSLCPEDKLFADRSSATEPRGVLKDRATFQMRENIVSLLKYLYMIEITLSQDVQQGSNIVGSFKYFF